jgi:hypothetical protein
MPLCHALDHAAACGAGGERDGERAGGGAGWRERWGGGVAERER